MEDTATDAPPDAAPDAAPDNAPLPPTELASPADSGAAEVAEALLSEAEANATTANAPAESADVLTDTPDGSCAGAPP